MNPRGSTTEDGGHGSNANMPTSSTHPGPTQPKIEVMSDEDSDDSAASFDEDDDDHIGSGGQHPTSTPGVNDDIAAQLASAGSDFK